MKKLRKKREEIIQDRAEAVAEEYADTIRDIYDLTQQSGSTRSDMRNTLDQIVGMCVGAVPDISDGDESE